MPFKKIFVLPRINYIALKEPRISSYVYKLEFCYSVTGPITCSSLTFHSFDGAHDEPHPRPSAGGNGLARQEDEHINVNQQIQRFPKARI